MEKFTLRTPQREILIDITSEVTACIKKSGVQDGFCFVFIPHTTAGVTINENADPAVKKDISETLRKLIPSGAHYHHLEGNADSHLKASIMGASVMVAIENGALMLGTWQGIQFCEFDGPRTRQVWVKVV